jgi:hypothetical protein
MFQINSAVLLHKKVKIMRQNYIFCSFVKSVESTESHLIWFTPNSQNFMIFFLTFCHMFSLTFQVHFLASGQNLLVFKKIWHRFYNRKNMQLAYGIDLITLEFECHIINYTIIKLYDHQDTYPRKIGVNLFAMDAQHKNQRSRCLILKHIFS